MTTIVDALLVTLGLDTKEYEKGTKKAEKEMAEFDCLIFFIGFQKE